MGTPTAQPRKSVYLDATIPSYHFDQRPAIATLTEATRIWWQDERTNYLLCTSAEMLAELATGEYPRQAEVIGFASTIPQLPPTDEIIDVARIYIERKVMPRSLKGDAIHLAYASYYRIDFLLTWNCSHLANANKQQHIRLVNACLHLATPEIVTPLQLVRETTDEA